MKKLFPWLTVLLMMLWLPATAQDAAAQDDITVQLAYDAQYAGCFTASYSEGPLTISEQNTVTLPSGKMLYLQGTTKDGNIYTISGITFGDTPGAATEDMMEPGLWYVRNLTDESIVTINFTVTPVPTDIHLTFVAEGASLSAIWLQGGYPRQNITIPTDGNLTVKSDKQPFAITATQAAYENALMVSDVKVTGAGAENATVECTNPAAGAWKVNGVADGQIITVVFSEIDTKTYKIPVVFNDIAATQVDILRYADDKVMELNDGQITYSALDDNPIYISTAEGVTDNEVTDVKIEGAGIVDSSTSGFWILYNLGESKIIVYGKNATPEPEPQPTEYKMPIKFVNCTAADVTINNAATDFNLPIVDDAISITSGIKELYIESATDENLSSVAVEGPGTVDEDYAPVAWFVSDFTSKTTLVITGSKTEPEPQPTTDITVTLNVEGATAADLDIIAADKNSVKVSEENKFTITPEQMPLIIQTSQAAYGEGKNVTAITSEPEGITATESSIITGQWTVTGLTDGMTLNVTVAAPAPVEDITVPIIVKGGDAKDLHITYDMFYTVDVKDVQTVTEGELSYQTANLTFPEGTKLTFESYGELGIESIEVTGEGTATCVNKEAELWGVTGLTAASKLTIGYDGSGIQALSVDNVANGDIYDMQGRRVLRAGQDINKLAAGIYIVNGRKQIVK